MARERPEVLDVEKPLTDALESEDGRVWPSIGFLEELTRADHSFDG